MRDSDFPSPAAVDEQPSVLARDDCRTAVRYFCRRSTDAVTVSDPADYDARSRAVPGHSPVEAWSNRAVERGGPPI